MRRIWDQRRVLEIADDALSFAVTDWLETARDAIAKRGRFSVALSGGSTPKAIYERLAKEAHALDWSKVWLFWSDERCVPPHDPKSNYRMAMEAGLKGLPIPVRQVVRMPGELEPRAAAEKYERQLEGVALDLAMLGVGEDGHTASLFPGTAALELKKPLVAANYVEAVKGWRLTLTFRAIAESRKAVVYALGKGKAEIVREVLQTGALPASLVGTEERPALWILDREAASLILSQK